MRYFVQLSYDGTPFHGWQVQPNAKSVQGTLTGSLSKLLDEPVEIMGAGRTDAGVHARKMIAHFDAGKPLHDNLVFRWNRFLPHEIAVERIWPLGHIPGKEGRGAHARFDATSRAYEYWIARRKDPFMTDRAWTWHGALDIAAMQTGAEVLKEYTDFESFSRSNSDVHTFNCRIYEAYFEERNHVLVFTIRADRFLRNMVRAIVGTLLEVGQGKRTLDDLRETIEKKDRMVAGTSAPACGLYLIDVAYPPEYTPSS